MQNRRRKRVKNEPIIELKRIKEAAARVGFDQCGVAAVRPFEEEKARFDGWLQAGHQASLGYLERNTEKRFDLTRLVPDARTVVVCAVSYKSPISEGYPPHHRAKIASYACNQDYHVTIKAMLRDMFNMLKEECPSLAGRAFVDSAPVAEKRWAVEAGLGWIGRQSLLITPQYGSFVHLGELVLNAACDGYDQPFTESHCGTCRACIDHCPTGAILEGQRMIDARRCIACHTIERQPDCEIDLHGWIFGCDACQSCCPYNRHAPMHRNPQFTPLFDPRTLTPDDWRAITSEEFSSRFAATPLPRSGLDRLQANLPAEEEI